MMAVEAHAARQILGIFTNRDCGYGTSYCKTSFMAYSLVANKTSFKAHSHDILAIT